MNKSFPLCERRGNISVGAWHDNTRVPHELFRRISRTRIPPFGFLFFSYLQIQTELSSNYIMGAAPSEARRRTMVLWHDDSFCLDL